MVVFMAVFVDLVGALFANQLELEERAERHWNILFFGGEGSFKRR